MARVDDFLNLVDDPSRRSLGAEDPADRALLELMVHVAFSDGVVAPKELDFLQKVLPGRSEADLLSWVKKTASRPFNFEAINEALVTVEERLKGLRFAARMAWKDGSIQAEEREFMDGLAKAWGLESAAVERVFAEIQVQISGAVDRKHLVETIKSASWGAVQVAGGQIESDLKIHAPAHLKPIARLGLDQIEVGAIYQEGFVARFMEGVNYIPWKEMVAYTRVATLGASLQIHTESGRTWTLVDTRLRGFAAFFDRLYSQGLENKSTRKPVITQTRGPDMDDSSS